MARVELAPDVLDDFDRFFDHMAWFEAEDVPRRIDEIAQAISSQREEGFGSDRWQREQLSGCRKTSHIPAMNLQNQEQVSFLVNFQVAPKTAQPDCLR